VSFHFCAVAIVSSMIKDKCQAPTFKSPREAVAGSLHIFLESGG